MSKKQDFIRSEQSRDKHPESDMKGSAAEVATRAGAKQDIDTQEPHSGKVANDHNKAGAQAATQVNEGQRTPDSRHDRESHAGSHNQVSARKGGGGGGRTPRGAG